MMTLHLPNVRTTANQLSSPTSNLDPLLLRSSRPSLRVNPCIKADPRAPGVHLHNTEDRSFDSAERPDYLPSTTHYLPNRRMRMPQMYPSTDGICLRTSFPLVQYLGPRHDMPIPLIHI